MILCYFRLGAPAAPGDRGTGLFLHINRSPGLRVPWFFGNCYFRWSDVVHSRKWPSAVRLFPSTSAVSALWSRAIPYLFFMALFRPNINDNLSFAVFHRPHGTFCLENLVNVVLRLPTVEPVEAVIVLVVNLFLPVCLQSH